jgi:pimeloyl-ACP methyl ester carboxylesterase
MKEIALVLLPGLDGTGELFGPLISCIPEEIKPIVISYPRNRQCSYIELKEIIMEELPRETDFFILGESFSGPLAIMIAGQRPEKLKGLILCATFITNPFRFIPSWIRIISISPIYRLWPFLIRIRTVHETNQIKELANMAISVIKTVNPDIIAGRIKSIFQVDVEKELVSFDLPILYIMGDKDRLIRKHNFEKIKKIRPDVFLSVIKTQHSILQREPLDAANVLIEFMETVMKKWR